MNANFTAAALVLLVSCLPGMADAQAPKGRGQADFDRQAFDSSVEHLPPNYRGHDCKAVYRSITKAGLKKDDFETQASYAARWSSRTDEVSYANVRFGDILALSPARESLFQYSPEFTEGKVVLIGTRQIYPGPPVEGGLPIEIVSESLASQGSYTGANAFGVTAKVAREDYRGCAIAMIGWPAASPTKPVFDLRARMGPDDARALKGQAAVLYVGTLALPLVAEYRDTMSPTLSRPQHRTWSGEAIIFKLQSIWLYNRATGQIYEKHDL